MSSEVSFLCGAGRYDRAARRGRLAANDPVTRGAARVGVPPPLGAGRGGTVCAPLADRLRRPEGGTRRRARARSQDLQARAHGPGVTYVVKLFLPWILASFDRAVVLDYDLWPRGPGALAGLVAQFDRFLDGEYVALAPDIAAPVLYPRAPLGANGGVQLMRLAEMRAGVWGSMLANHTARVGYLGDQTVYAHLSVAHPGRLRRLSCRWNRQLNAHFHLPTAAYECADGCAIVHGNQPQRRRRARPRACRRIVRSDRRGAAEAASSRRWRTATRTRRAPRTSGKRCMSETSLCSLISLFFLWTGRRRHAVRAPTRSNSCIFAMRSG